MPFFHRIALLLLGLAATLLAVPTVIPGAPDVPARRPNEALCGPEIVLLGDAWEHVQLERDALRALARAGDLVRVPQRAAAISSHLSFMHNRSLMVFGEARQQLDRSLEEVFALFARLNALALGGDRAAVVRELPALDAHLSQIGRLYPEEALISSSATSFLLPQVVPSLQIRLLEPPVLEAGKEVTVRFLLLNPAGRGTVPDALHTTHTQKLHALVLDPLFRDYHHAHPQPSGESGEYAFTFTPRVAGPYRLWLDAMPVATGRGEFPVVDLAKIPRPITKAPAPHGSILRATTEGWDAELTVPGDAFVFGQLNVAALTVRDRQGRPATNLQPVMGAFAHIVGFAEDFYTILHIHPLGVMPRADELGGPKIDFQLRPTQPGWLRLYVQAQIEGKSLLFEFAVPVVVR